MEFYDVKTEGPFSDSKTTGESTLLLRTRDERGFRKRFSAVRHFYDTQSRTGAQERGNGFELPIRMEHIRKFSAARSLRSVADSFTGKVQQMSDDKEQKVLEAMKQAGKPVRPGDLAKALGVESKEMSKVIDSLKKQGKVMSPKRCYYAPAGE